MGDLFRFVLRRLSGHRGRLTLAFTAMGGVALASVAFARLMQVLFDDILVTDSSRRSLWMFIGMLTAAVGLKGLCMFVSNYTMAEVGEGIIKQLRDEMYRKIQHQPLRFFSEHQTGVLTARIISDVEKLRNVLSTDLPTILKDGLLLVVFVCYLCWRDWRLSLIAFATLPCIGFLITKMARRLRRSSRQSQERMGTIAAILTETISGVRIVKAFGMERFEVKKFQRATRRLREANLKRLKLGYLTGPVIELIGYVGIAVILTYGHWAITHGLRTTGEFTEYITGLVLLYQPLRRLGKLNARIQLAVVSCQRVHFILDRDQEVPEAPGTRTLATVTRGIRFENVSFSYGEGKVLRTISFEVPQGRVLAVVGPSGAGKSTLANLIPRFYDVEAGTITIDGTDIRHFSLASLRGAIGLVTQDSILFNDTVTANISYGEEGVDPERVAEAARTAYADQFIRELPDGYDTLLGEQGTRLSGGQRQRIAIARALYKNPPILILDEATSALDSESELLVQNALYNLMKGRTTLVIAHRLSTVRRADAILVLEEGEVKEYGTHRDLLHKNGTYSRLYQLQFAEEGG